MRDEERPEVETGGGPLGSRLRAAREARGLTQAQAAAELRKPALAHRHGEG